MIPIIMFHYGRQEFVHTALKQASKQNTKVILLGDKSNRDFPAEHHYFKDYAKGAKELRSYYVSMTTDDYEMNIFNTQRYLMLSEFVEARGYDRVFTCDSDVMVHCDVEKEFKRLGECTVALDIPKTQSQVRMVALGNGYWTRQALRDYGVFLREAYTENKWLDRMKRQWQWYQNTGSLGGVSDMTTLKLFSEVYPGILNISKVIDNVTFDHAISTAENWFPHEYRTVSYKGWTLKQVEWRKDIPYVYNLVLDRWIRFCTLHYQGGRKGMLMGDRSWTKSL